MSIVEKVGRQSACICVCVAIRKKERAGVDGSEEDEDSVLESTVCSSFYLLDFFRMHDSSYKTFQLIFVWQKLDFPLRIFFLFVLACVV